MRSRLICAALVALLSSAARGEADYPEGMSRHEATEERAAFHLHLPQSLPRRGLPLVVALHEMGGSDEAVVQALTSFAERGKYALLCPRARGLKFGDEDLEPLLNAVREVRDGLPAGTVHLVGIGDAGYQALRFAFSRPREFRSVVTLGTDVPSMRPKSGASSLRVLVMKGAEDRPAAGRESLEAVRKDLDLAEFREVAGAGLSMDAATLAYVQHFIDAAAGRRSRGRDQNLPWRDSARGLSERARRKAPALIYFYDESPEYASRTDRIQGSVLMDTKVRKAMVDAIPILARRTEAGKIVPDAKLRPGPAIVVLDAEGELKGILQRKITPGAIAALLAGR